MAGDKFWIEMLIYQAGTGINPNTKKRQEMVPAQWFALQKVGIEKPINAERFAQAKAAVIEVCYGGRDPELHRKPIDYEDIPF